MAFGRAPGRRSSVLALVWTLALVLGVGGSVGCGEDPPPPKKTPSRTRPPRAPADTAAEIPASPATGIDAVDDAEIAYVYSPIGKRDPFRSLFEQFQQGPEAEELTELQKFELDQLKLVGIVSRIATPYALVEDPNGKGHTLTRGKLIGKNWGRVSAITSDCVIIKEEYREYTGRKVTNKTEMCIPKPTDLELE